MDFKDIILAKTPNKIKLPKAFYFFVIVEFWQIITLQNTTTGGGLGTAVFFYKNKTKKYAKDFLLGEPPPKIPPLQFNLFGKSNPFNWAKNVPPTKKGGVMIKTQGVPPTPFWAFGSIWPVLPKQKTGFLVIFFIINPKKKFFCWQKKIKRIRAFFWQKFSNREKKMLFFSFFLLLSKNDNFP